MHLNPFSRRFSFVPGLLALLLAAEGSSGCGGCYTTGSSSDVQVVPASACLAVAAGQFENGCGSGTSGIVVSNLCSGALVLGTTSVAPGERDVAVFGNPVASGARRTLSGTLDGTPITISWQDAAEATGATADMGAGG